MAEETVEGLVEHGEDTQIQDPFADDEERRVLVAALQSFLQYRKSAHHTITHRRRQKFYALPTPHGQILSFKPFNYLQTLEKVDAAIDANANIAEEMVREAPEMLGFDVSPEGESFVTAHHIEKANSTLRQLYRDWSAEGAPERKACYDPILQDLDLEFLDCHDKNGIRILVPGVGLNRLLFEICLKGYTAEGNEISWHQAIAGNWILNCTEIGKKHDLYPFATEFSNVVSRRQQFQVVKVPDVYPGKALGDASDGSRIPCHERLSVSTGDFLTIYGKEEFSSRFDAVATVFFIDTAPNVVRYIETVYHCLKTGGIWTNLGPLLWHFENRVPDEMVEDDAVPASATRLRGIEEPGSVELTNEEVLLLVEQMGFSIEISEDAPVTGYIHNENSMLQSTYKPSHWVARKRA
ncbi:hypothetical protein ACLMJK_002420 [Lecanora helva]